MDILLAGGSLAFSSPDGYFFATTTTNLGDGNTHTVVASYDVTNTLTCTIDGVTQLFGGGRGDWRGSLNIGSGSTYFGYDPANGFAGDGWIANVVMGKTPSSPIASYTLNGTPDDQTGGTYNGTWTGIPVYGGVATYPGPVTASSGNYITGGCFMPTGNNAWNVTFTFVTSSSASCGFIAWGGGDGPASAIAIELLDATDLTTMGSSGAGRIAITAYDYGTLILSSAGLNDGNQHTVVLNYNGSELTATVDGAPQTISTYLLNWQGNLNIGSGSTYLGYTEGINSIDVNYGNGTISNVVMGQMNSTTYDIYAMGSSVSVSVTGPDGMTPVGKDPTAPISATAGLSWRQ